MIVSLSESQGNSHFKSLSTEANIPKNDAHLPKVPIKVSSNSIFTIKAFDHISNSLKSSTGVFNTLIRLNDSVNHPFSVCCSRVVNYSRASLNKKSGFKQVGKPT